MQTHTIKIQRQKLFIQQLKQLKQQNYIVKAEDNHFDILHITFKGLENSVFQNMTFHVRLDLQLYPQQAPVIKMLSPSCVYDIDTALCIQSISHFHEEAYQFLSITEIIEALKIHMASLVTKTEQEQVEHEKLKETNKEKAMNGIGSHYRTEQQVIEYMKQHQSFTCSCGENIVQ